MLIVKLWNFLRGYLVVKIRGIHLEKFINLCSRNNIYLWDVVRQDTTLTVKIAAADFYRIRRIARKTRCKAYIEKKQGLPFFYIKLKKRKLLLVGGVLFIVVLYWLSSFIWFVEVEGLETLEESQILNQLQSLGFKEGIWKYSLDLDEIEDKLILKNDKLSWVNIKIKGVKAIVKVIEKKEPPEIKPHIPCDIVADKRGLIVNVKALKGDPLVKKGDMVEKGQVLISGIIELEEAENYYVHAEGEVSAACWYKEKIEAPIVEQQKVKTGNKKVIYRLKVGSKQIQLSNSKHSFKDYVVEQETKTLLKWRNINLSVELIKEIIFETQINKKFIGVDKAVEKAKQKLKHIVMEKIPEDAEIVSMEYQKKVLASNNTVLVEVLVQTQESIGVKKPLIVDKTPTKRGGMDF